MKKILLTALATAGLTATRAQSLEAIKIGMIETGSNCTFVNPQTAVRVTVTVRQESVRKGPYSRYSQKYLGVIAPLTDKENYTLTGATIEGVDPRMDLIPTAMPYLSPQPALPAITVSEPKTARHLESDTGFVRLPVNVTAAVGKSVEEMAADAAKTIFALRKHRMELLTYSDATAGAGFAAAVEELRRMEEEYLTLFFGKQFTRQIVRTFEVIPDGRKLSFTVLRFSDTDGPLDAEATDGRPLTLELREQKIDFRQEQLPKKYTSIDSYLMPAVMECRVVDGATVLVTSRLPLYQYGRIIEVAQ
ncbi:MAG: DUF4831 family protein [Rikenellaceae bacterium]|jgi:hypothetical protein|nr:DUF4831 family protein [Rikenellaceae bacterium]